MSLPAKPLSGLRVAVVCNWNDKCGISTYSNFLVNAIRPKVQEVRVFSEDAIEQTAPDEDFVVRCWRRGNNLRPAFQKMIDWKPDFIIIQHEYGIFPNACHFFKAMQMIDDIPYVVTMHSVYQHQDKAVYASVVKNIVVHSEQGKQCLHDSGITNNISVVPHGCVSFSDTTELWNILHNPYTILQFGFGFRYKGVDRVLEAVSLLKHGDPKFANIFYCFLLSTNQHNSRAHAEYYESLLVKIKELDIEDNVVILRKYNSEQIINLFLRLFKLAVFPYVMQADNTVYGASGAARIALANKIPVIVSESHLFDDFEGVLPRPDSAEALAKEIDHIFSDDAHRDRILAKSREYCDKYSWPNVADQYLALYTSLCS